jgi:hydrogenase maturation protease
MRPLATDGGSMALPRILVAGIGNIFLGDDAFGVEVVRRLSARPLPDNVRVVDFGIRGFDLAYALLDGYDLAVLVDATPRGESPGTLYAIEPEIDLPDGHESEPMNIEMHGMDPARVLSMVRAMGGEFRQIMLVGCEPAPLSAEELEHGSMGLSAPVSASVDDAVGMVESIIRKFLDEIGKDTGLRLDEKEGEP